MILPYFRSSKRTDSGRPFATIALVDRWTALSPWQRLGIALVALAIAEAVATAVLWTMR